VTQTAAITAGTGSEPLGTVNDRLQAPALFTGTCTFSGSDVDDTDT
jgi:hypothetical protein